MLQKVVLLSFLLTSSFLACKEKMATGQIERRPFMVYDPALNSIINTSYQLDTLGDGYKWSEGPVWIADLEKLLFSDVPENRIYQWEEGKGVSVYLEPSGFTGSGTKSGEPGSNGLALDADGQLLLCQHGDRRVARMGSKLDAPAPEFTTLADNFEGKKFNSPNDLHIASDGKIYFTDPPYGLSSSEAKELDFCGVYVIDTTGEVHLLVDSLTRPNGIALALDEQKLYVANSDPVKAVWYEFTLDTSGTAVTSGKILFDATPFIEENSGYPDGLKVHSSGLVFATGLNGVLIINPDGKLMGVIETGKPTANCGFDSEETYLYMTSYYQLLRIRIK